MPTVSSNNDNYWDVVIRRPSRKKRKGNSSYTICTPERDILIHFPDSKVSGNIRNAAKSFLVEHNPVREKGEGGIMVAAGNRIDYVTCAKTSYQNKKSTFGLNVMGKLLNKASSDFHHLFQEGPTRNLLEKEVSRLEQDHIAIKNSTENYGKQLLHPFHAFSRNLTNSIHKDNSDHSRTFAIWFREGDVVKNDGLTWFLFPFYGVAIECSSFTTISWDGRAMFHCSCTVNSGIISTCATSKKKSGQSCKGKH